MISFKKKKAVICDLDGTFINCEHRHHFIGGEEKDWKSFFDPKQIAKDTPYLWCRELLLSMNKQGYIILFITSRKESHRLDTIKTLLQYWYSHSPEFINGAGSHLFMRKNEDERKDSIVKEEIFKEYVDSLYDVIFCIEDRKCVTDMWRSLGLICLHCAEGNF